jgi:tetratricopeptide (TPR) repeat protein
MTQYQAFFPPDVTYVADHAKRAVSSFPVARNFYYGVDYTNGVDITWYRNIPVPTSYMVLDSGHDFFGGYDHARRAGLVHVADRHVAPGKKLWTWGNAPFGYAWDRELTDADGPYVELMAGVFTDNQPDFSWLQPYETRTFCQYWYPIQEIGPAQNANRLLAISLKRAGRKAQVGCCVAESFRGLRILMTVGEKLLLEQTLDIRPGQPFLESVELPSDCLERDLLIRVLSSDGKELIRYCPEQHSEVTLPDPATEPPPPTDIVTLEELYLTGLHLEQYRHATRSPEAYWEEGLRRDSLDARCNNAMGLLRLRRGQFQEAEQHFRRAIERLTRRNPNPHDSEPFYNLGLALKYQERGQEAYAAFYKSVWNQAWKSSGYYALATIACGRGDFEQALLHLKHSLSVNIDHLKARNLQTAILRRLGRKQEALDLVRETIAADPLDFWSANEFATLSDKAQLPDTAQAIFSPILQSQTCLDVAFDYADAGLWAEAASLLQKHLAALPEKQKAYPIVLYAVGYFCAKNGESAKGHEYFGEAAQAPPDYCLPARLEEMLVLQEAIRLNPPDAKAHYYLGNLLYDKHRREEAIQIWERSCQLDSSFAIPWRNLGIAWFNVRENPQRALECYETAFRANPSDARLLFELDQLRKHVGVSAAERLACLEERRDLVDQRNDLVVELITLYNQVGRCEEALATLISRRFHPWEGGEGLVSGQYVAAHLLLGRRLLEDGDAENALVHFREARQYPENLGEGKHLLTLETHLDYFSGVAVHDLQRSEEARKVWLRAAQTNCGNTDMTFYKALALRSLGYESEAVSEFGRLLDFATRQIRVVPKIDYFATSLPNFLLFDDDLEKRNRIESLYLMGLARLGLGRSEEASTDFRSVLALDGNHLGAQTELNRLEAVPAAK